MVSCRASPQGLDLPTGEGAGAVGVLFVTMTPAIVRQLQELRRQLLDPPAVEKVTTTRKRRVVTAAA